MEIINEAYVGKRVFLLGNEAITRGALEAGVAVATTYPGTPANEISDAFSKIAKISLAAQTDPGFYFEYSVNEKVALEVSIAASHSGLRTLTCMKHVGMNVAADALFSYTYMGCRGGHVIVSADDPHCFSSQNEQDNRLYAVFAGLPMLEPSTPAEAKEMTRAGFDISETLKLPVLLRTTTRLNHARGPVKFGKRTAAVKKGKFIKNPELITTPAAARLRHPLLLKRLDEAEKISETSSFNTVVTSDASADIGIITSGVSYNYAKEALDELGRDAHILKLGMTHPVPRQKCADFIRDCRVIIVVEELEPVLESQIKALAQETGHPATIYGKHTGHFSRTLEYTPDSVMAALAKIIRGKSSSEKPFASEVKAPARPMSFCAGCMHRATYYAVRQLIPEESVVTNDIGCYGLGPAPPFRVGDISLCMGANLGLACGFAVATDHKVFSFMGDSTFFHSGIPPLLNAAHHNLDCVITILDNRITAMTGIQPHPGAAYDGMGRPARAIQVESVAKGCGVDHIEIVDPHDIGKTIEAFQRAIAFPGPSVVVSKSPCALLDAKEKKGKPEQKRKFQIDPAACEDCGTCVSDFGCPAFFIAQDGNLQIDGHLCNGCGVCRQICPVEAISGA